MLAAWTLLFVVGADADPAALLARAEREYEALELEAVLRTTSALSALDEVPDGVFVRAQVLRGGALAVLGRIVEAETPFRLVLRVRPGFDLPPDTPPKILTVFRKVQADERALAAELAEIRRQRLRAGLEVRPRLPDTHPGGLPLSVEVDVEDPARGVAQVVLSYRMGLTGSYDTLSLAREPAGPWRAVVAAERTASPDGVVMCWYVEARAADGALLTQVGRPDAPRVTEVTPGVPSDHAAITSKWWFWTSVVAVVAAGTVSAVVIARSQASLPDSDLGAVSFR